MSFAPDQGVDGVAAYYFPTRKLLANADFTPHMSHGANNDAWLCLSEIGIKSQVLLWLVTFNIPCGPWASVARFQECRAALREFYDPS